MCFWTISEIQQQQQQQQQQQIYKNPCRSQELKP